MVDDPLTEHFLRKLSEDAGFVAPNKMILSTIGTRYIALRNACRRMPKDFHWGEELVSALPYEFHYGNAP